MITYEVICFINYLISGLWYFIINVIFIISYANENDFEINADDNI